MGISSRKNRLPGNRQPLAGDRPLRANRVASLVVGCMLIVAGSLSGMTLESAKGSVPTAAATSKTAPTPACRIRVTVKSKADGKPLARAVVLLLRPDHERRFQTDAEGIAVVEDLPPREHVFQVRADGYAGQTVAVAATAPGSTADLGFALVPGGQLRGTVRDSDGRPMSQVRLTLEEGWGVSYSRPAFDAVTTDVQGRFQFDNLPLGETLTISVEHGKRVLQKTVLLSPDERNVTADFAFDKQPETGSILVHVTGPDHQPIAGARLSNRGISPQQCREGTTDAKGDCRIDNVVSLFGRYLLAARAKGFAPDIRDFKAGTSARPNRIAIELEQGHTLRARVMLTNGRPAANARVIFDGGAAPPFRLGGEARTDRNGRVALDSLSPRGQFAIDQVAGFAPLCDVPLPLDRDTEITVTLDTAAVIKGRVVDDASGRPVVPWRIRVEASPRVGEPRAQFDARLGRAGQLQLRPDGRFEFGGQPPGAPIQLKISAEGYADQTLDRVIARPDEQCKPLEIRLRKLEPRDLLTVSGRLLDAREKPVVGAELRLWTVVPRAVPRAASSIEWNEIKNGSFERSLACQQFLVGVTDKQGGFTFPQVRAAGYAEIAYWKQGLDPAREAVPLAGPAPRLVRLTLHARAPARLIVEADPKDWPNGGLVTVSGEKTFVVPSQLLRGDRPRVTFEDLPTGELTVRFNAWARGGDRDDAYGSTMERHVTLKSGETTTFRFEKP
jgi:carboxypeptidase family protein